MNLQIYFDRGTCFIAADNYEFVNSYESPSAYFNLLKDEKYLAHPGTIFKVGDSEFALERFNTGIVADIGARRAMEDTYVSVHDLEIDDYLKVSLFAVIDGHGGDHCAHFLRQ
jgi:hypothetical protein